MIEITLAAEDGRKFIIQFNARERAQNKADLSVYILGTEANTANPCPAEKNWIYADECISLAAEKPRRKLLAILKDYGLVVPEATLLLAWQQYLTKENEVIVNPTTAPVAEVSIGSMKQPRTEFKKVSAPTYLEAFKTALEVPPLLDGVIEWDDATQLAILDLDFHDRPECDRSPVQYLESLAHGIKPAPTGFWVTHGRGLHLLYTKRGLFDANELAAAAALSALNLDGSCTVEVLARTRHPESIRSKQ